MDSSVCDRQLVEDVLEGLGGVGETFGAGEAEGELGDDKVRFKDHETVVTALHRSFHKAGNLAVTGAGRNVAVRLGIVVLDVKMPDPSVQQAPGLVDVLTDLDVVSRIERMGQDRGIDALEQVADALGRVAVDSLLIFEQQGYAPAIGPRASSFILAMTASR